MQKALEAQENDLIRCKNCEHYKDNTEVRFNGCAMWLGISECEAWHYEITSPDGWCYKAEKRVTRSGRNI